MSQFNQHKVVRHASYYMRGKGTIVPVNAPKLPEVKFWADNGLKTIRHFEFKLCALIVI